MAVVPGDPTPEIWPEFRRIAEKYEWRGLRHEQLERFEKVSSGNRAAERTTLYI